MRQGKVEHVASVGAELGEHPMWSRKERCLYWIDIEREAISRLDPRTGKIEVRSIPSKPGCFAFRGDGTLVVAARDGLYTLHFPSGTTSLLMSPQHDPATTRFNDGRTDRQGRLWVSTVPADLLAPSTQDNRWYRLDRLGLQPMLYAGAVPNGLAFSPDGKTMFRAETLSRCIYAYDYNVEAGEPTNERIFAVVPTSLGAPDGATVDETGGYWVALAAPQDGSAETGGVARFTSDGALDVYVRFPVPMVTMVAFGGADMSTLYATTARLSVFMPNGVPPGAGDIYAITTDHRGMPETAISVL